MQALAVTGLHAVQVAPPLPQLPAAGTEQVLPAQQPLGQLAALQGPPVQTPLLHVWPAPHAGPGPQRHSPFAEQVLAREGSHATQVSPPTPHDVRFRTVHVEPLQHPAGQLVASHAHWPPTQRWPVAQAGPPPQPQLPLVHESVRVRSQVAHEAPAAPQLEIEAALHVEPTQHPAAHDAASHTHAPPAHRCPAAHAAPVPHWHAPSALHESAAAGSQATHDVPARPHVLAVGFLHVSPTQQPPGHEVSLHLLTAGAAPLTQKPWVRSQRASGGHCASVLHRA